MKRSLIASRFFSFGRGDDCVPVRRGLSDPGPAGAAQHARAESPLAADPSIAENLLRFSSGNLAGSHVNQGVVVRTKELSRRVAAFLLGLALCASWELVWDFLFISAVRPDYSSHYLVVGGIVIGVAAIAIGWVNWIGRSRGK